MTRFARQAGCQWGTGARTKVNKKLFFRFCARKCVANSIKWLCVYSCANKSIRKKKCCFTRFLIRFESGRRKRTLKLNLKGENSGDMITKFNKMTSTDIFQKKESSNFHCLSPTTRSSDAERDQICLEKNEKWERKNKF